MIWPSKVGMVGLSIKKNRKSISSQKNSKKGFTLVELIVVLVILAIMAAAIVPALLGFTDNAKEKEYKADAEACLKASQTTLSDLYTDSANKLTPDKRVSAANMANVSPTGTTFKVWTSKSLEDGKTPATMDNMGSYTIVYAYYATSNDDNAKYLFFDGKEWTVFSEQNEVLEVIYNKGLITAKSVAALDTTDFSDSKNSTIIHMWPYHSDTAYVTDKEYAEANEEWKDEKTTITKKVNIKLAHNGKKEADRSPGDNFGVVLDNGTDHNIQLETPEIQLTFEINADNISEIECNDWINFGTDNEAFVYNNVTYKVKADAGYKDIIWSASDEVRPTTNDWDSILKAVASSTEESINIYAWTTKTYSSHTAVFTAKEGSVFEIEGATNNEVPVTCYMYDNGHDVTFEDNADIPESSGIVTGLSNISDDKMKPDSWNFTGWACSEDGNIEYVSEDNPKKYFENGVSEEAVWSKICEDNTPKKFLGILERTKNVTLKAGEDSNGKTHCHFGTAESTKTLRFIMNENEFTGKKSDDFMNYRQNIIDIDNNYKFVQWNLVSEDGVELTTPVETGTRRVGVLKNSIESSNSADLVYEAETVEKNGGKFISGAASTVGTFGWGITQSGNGDKTRIVSVVREDYDDAVDLLNRKTESDGKGLFDDKVYAKAPDPELDENNEIDGDIIFDRVANINFTGFDNPKGFTPVVKGSKSAFFQVDNNYIHRVFILWDGSDSDHETPIFAYTVPVSKSANNAPVNDFERKNPDHGLELHWFTEDPNPELIGDFSGLFNGCTDAAINASSGLDTFDTAGCTNMKEMFKGCKKLTYLDMSSWNMGQVTSVEGMFNGCSTLATVTFSDSSMSAVTSVRYMFNGCAELTSVDLSNRGISGVNSLESMFNGCSKLTSANISGNNMTSVTSTKDMFNGCGELLTVDLSGNPITALSDMSNMFKNCKKVESVNMADIGTAAGCNMASLFNGASNLKTLEFNGSVKPGAANNMFTGCEKLTKAEFTNWDLSGTGSMSQIFLNCKAIKTIDFGDTSSTTISNLAEAFRNCYELTSINMPNVGTASSCNMSNMCNGDKLLETISLNGTVKPGAANNMFTGCEKLTKAEFTNWDLSGTGSMGQIFLNCKAIKTIDFGNTSSTTISNMAEAFRYCYELTSINMPNVGTASSCNMSNMCNGDKLLETISLNGTVKPGAANNMFTSCEKLTKAEFTNWDLFGTGSMGQIFLNCKAIKTIDFGNTSSTTISNMVEAFRYCYELTSINMPNVGTASSCNMSNMCNGDKLLETISLNGTVKPGAANNMFTGCEKLTKAEFTNWDLSGTGSMYQMFYNCLAITVVDFGDNNTETITSFEQTFQNCEKLKTVYLKGVGTVASCSTKNMFGHNYELTDLVVDGKIKSGNLNRTFDGCKKIKTIDISSWDMSGATDLYGLCNTAEKLESITMGTGNPKNAKDYRRIFINCSNLKSVDISLWTFESATDVSQAFDGCSKLTKVTFNDNVNFSKLTSMNLIFSGCSSITANEFSNMISKWNLDSCGINFNGNSSVNKIFNGTMHSDFSTSHTFASKGTKTFKIGGTGNALYYLRVTN